MAPNKLSMSARDSFCFSNASVTYWKGSIFNQSVYFINPSEIVAYMTIHMYYMCTGV